MEKLSSAHEKRRPGRRYARAVAVAICCACLICVAAGAHPATQLPHALAERLAKLRPPVDGATWWGCFVEGTLDHWVPTKENEHVPAAAIQSPQTDISGTWEDRHHLEGTSFTITRSGPDSYDITFDTHGCCGWWKLFRTGHYSGGVLVLNRPVRQYSSLTYQKLYAVRAGGTEYLVSDVAVGIIQNGVAPDKSSVGESVGIAYYAFTRTPPTPSTSERHGTAPPPDKPK